MSSGAGGAQLAEKTMSTQDQSFFFQLPWEIRQEIYHELLAGYNMRIIFIEAYRRMGHWRWKQEGCGSSQRIMMKQKGAPDEWGVVDLLAVPQTCKLM